MRLLAAVALAAAPAFADDAGRLAACTDRHLPDTAAAEAACIGLLSQPCMATAEGGTTLGMTDCMAAETAAWDALLNRAWPELMAEARAADAELAETWTGAQPASRADALRTAQRAWIAFRDADCGEAYARWGIGSMRHTAASACLMEMTAARAIEFRARLADPGR